MTYEYSGFFIDEDDEIEQMGFIQQPRKKSMNSTEYSFKNITYYEDSIDQYLVLDPKTNGGSTGEPWTGVSSRKKPMGNQEAIRIRNKINAKKSRDRKKNQYENVNYRLKELENENDRLRKSKSHCSRCNTKLTDSSYGITINPKHEQLKQQRRIDIEFERPDFKPDRGRTGKIWIAVGIIMLILGMNIHGLSHKEPIEINLKKSVVAGLKDQLRGNEDNIKLPITFRSPLQQKPEVDNKQSKLLEVSMQGLRIKSLDDKTTCQDKPSEEEHFEISRDFLSRLSGQIDDIGRYI